ncbi:MAG TPA: 3-hydroxyacyl-CoA dehydrogenase NAD-binding domain-containing protein [Candidatus Angelobacter sp.]|nr:3-hydroxyacyl-CoA dehydrogenase NAD-binding domain-containing protein [Candidatus Angelobacter sp.]
MKPAKQLPVKTRPAKEEPSVSESAPAILTIAVIGAGAEGRAIASALAQAGYRTILEDILPGSLRQAQAAIRQHLDTVAAKDGAGRESADAAFARIEYALTVEQAAREADLVIECVPDELESKLEIFTLLDKVCRPHTMLASTTSTLSVSDVASVTYRAERCVGLQFSPNCLAIVRGSLTSDETMNSLVEMGRKIGVRTEQRTDAEASV